MRVEVRELLNGIDGAGDEVGLGDLVGARGREVLRADAVGFYFYGGPETAPVACVVGLPPAFAPLYERAGRSIDPVLAEVNDTHAAACSDHLLGTRAWRTHPLYRRVSGQFGLEHIMTAPLIGAGGVIGTVNAGRRSTEDSFLHDDLAVISAVAAHSSVMLARRAAPAQAQRRSPDSLTARDWQIVQLVADGLTNASVARRLGVTEHAVKQALKSIFRKTGASSRTQLATFVASW